MKGKIIQGYKVTRFQGHTCDLATLRLCDLVTIKFDL